jgi:hypothetical protein
MGTRDYRCCVLSANSVNNLQAINFQAEDSFLSLYKFCLLLNVIVFFPLTVPRDRKITLHFELSEPLR